LLHQITEMLPQSLPRKDYKGRRVVVSPVRGGDGPNGEIWTDEATHFVLYSQTEVKSKLGTLRTIWETDEFIAGVEPNSDIFKPPVESGYKVIDKRK